MNKKKVAGLAALKQVKAPSAPVEVVPEKRSLPKKNKLKNFPLLLHPAVHEVLRTLAFNEKISMTKHILEGLDLLFKQKGIASIQELIEQAELKK